MFLTKKRYQSKIDLANAQRNRAVEEMKEWERVMHEQRVVINLLLDTRLPENVRPKRLVHECIDPTLKKRAFSAAARLGWVGQRR